MNGKSKPLKKPCCSCKSRRSWHEESLLAHKWTTMRRELCVQRTNTDLSENTELAHIINSEGIFFSFQSLSPLLSSLSNCVDLLRSLCNCASKSATFCEFAAQGGHVSNVITQQQVSPRASAPLRHRHHQKRSFINSTNNFEINIVFN